VALDATALLVQLLQQQHLQAVLANANAELAAAEALAQQRRAGAGPAPTFHGTKPDDELAVNTWLDALESWFALAHVDIDADAERIEVAVAALRGPVQKWWASTRAADAATVAAGGTTAIDKWADVVALFRKSYLPQDPARWAMQQLEVLKHGNNADVQSYTNRFLQLDLMIVGQQNELARVFAYEQGLPESYRVRSAEKQHATLAAAIASSLALWNAKSVARSQSQSQSHGGSRHGSMAKLHHTHVDESDEETGAAGPLQGQASASAASSSSAITKLEQKLDAFISAMQMQASKGSTGGGGAGRGRGRERQQEGVSRPARSKTPGVSDELAKQRLQAGVCIKCAQPGHYARDCKNEVKTN
jgi:Retrotransposon gag protein/Zinc knuckle